jgi:hypothetical protein
MDRPPHRSEPRRAIEALELAGTQVARQFEGTNLDTTGLGVSWAGADPAPKWLDIAREFTEYWTHRQQIRHAIGKATDPESNALRMVLDTFMRALPHTLRHTPAPSGTDLQVVVDEPAAGTWTVTATADRWSLAEAPTGRPAASVRLDPETAWRLRTRGIDPGTALARARISGDHQIAEQPARSCPSSTDADCCDEGHCPGVTVCHRWRTVSSLLCCSSRSVRM